MDYIGGGTGELDGGWRAETEAFYLDMVMSAVWRIRIEFAVSMFV